MSELKVCPPVVETIMGVQFTPLSKLRVTDFGLFQQSLGEREFSKVEERERLLPIIERSGPLVAERLFQISSAVELPRVLFIGPKTEKGQQVIQIQQDRFLQNWRTAAGKSDYPTFEYNCDQFERSFAKFETFIEERGLGTIRIDQAELTYVNHIPIETGTKSWRSASNIFRIFRHIESIELEGFSFSGSNWNNELSGRIYLMVQPAQASQSDKTLLDFRLVARGAPAGSSYGSALDWLKSAHVKVIEHLVRMVEPAEYKKWGISGS